MHGDNVPTGLFLDMFSWLDWMHDISYSLTGYVVCLFQFGRLRWHQLHGKRSYSFKIFWVGGTPQALSDRGCLPAAPQWVPCAVQAWQIASFSIFSCDCPIFLLVNYRVWHALDGLKLHGFFQNFLGDTHSPGPFWATFAVGACGTQLRGHPAHLPVFFFRIHFYSFQYQMSCYMVLVNRRTEWIAIGCSGLSYPSCWNL